MDPIISILIVSHNQRLLLERCLDSVLKQEIKVLYEIIVSDDRSTDGTQEFVTSLIGSERVTKIKNLVGLYYIRCNSDECSPNYTTQRIGWNRLTAYKHARGKYFVNVDADDFLINTELYQKEYEMLESHPECSMVQTRAFKLDVGESLDQVRECFPFSEKLETGAVFSLEEVLSYGLRGQHQTYMYRRRPQDDMERLFGCRFEDIVITYHHLQYGPVVFLDIIGYVWMQYPNTDSHSLNIDDRKVIYGLIPLSLAMLFKELKYVFLGLGVKKLWYTIITAPIYPELSSRGRDGCSRKKAFIYRFYSEHQHNIYSYLRYWIVWLSLRLMKHFRLESRFWLDYLYRVMV